MVVNTVTNLLSFLDDDEVKNTQTAVYDTPVDRLASPLALASWPKTRVTFGQQ